MRNEICNRPKVIKKSLLSIDTQDNNLNASDTDMEDIGVLQGALPEIY